MAASAPDRGASAAPAQRTSVVGGWGHVVLSPRSDAAVLDRSERPPSAHLAAAPSAPVSAALQPASDAKEASAAAPPRARVRLIAQQHPADPRKEIGPMEIFVDEEDAQFDLRPQHIGGQIVHLNAKNEAFYRRRLAAPVATMWVLTLRAEDEALGYVLQRLYEAGRNANVQVDFLVPDKFDVVVMPHRHRGIVYGGQELSLPNCVLSRIGATLTQHTIAVLRQVCAIKRLEFLGVLVLNPMSAVELCRDKLLTMQFLAAHGIAVPRTVAVRFPFRKTQPVPFPFPVVLKKCSGSQGKGVMKMDTQAQLDETLHMCDPRKPVIVQEFIEASHGKDLRVYVIGGKIVASMLRVASKGFKANVHQGADVHHVRLAPAVEFLVLETVRLCGLDIAGVDLLVGQEAYFVCEINSSPGFEGLERATLVDVAEETIQYALVRLGLFRAPPPAAPLTVRPVPAPNPALA